MSGDLRIEGLRLHSGDALLVDGVDLSVASGRVLALVGASGGGKTLSTLALLGLLPPGVRRTGGRVSLDGRALEPAALRGRTVGLVQQNPRSAFNPLLSIGGHFAETLGGIGLRGRAMRERALALLAETGFERPAAILPLHPFQLSGGMLQRAMIALALSLEPRFLLADEPTTDLDAILQAQLLDLLDRLRSARGLGILLVTHDLSVVARLADEVAVMAGGRIVEQAPASLLFHRPRHQVTRALLDTHFALYDHQPAAAAA
ncbi:ATP-binding cassette domain-containing protein [Geminicoccus roseus]|uniref:ATP-binding cassette domain-containing protein n=1 Tax=Geminicoccus roseus TaxID=404900 RepID=UPI00040DB547|nr:ATP-binding cassette domain-containing protein [Geminicoccus roseus]